MTVPLMYMTVHSSLKIGIRTEIKRRYTPLTNTYIYESLQLHGRNQHSVTRIIQCQRSCQFTSEQKINEIKSQNPASRGLINPNCYRLILITLPPLIRAQDITLDELQYELGILPFRLGPTKFISHYHSFLQFIKLQSLTRAYLCIRSIDATLKLATLRNMLDGLNYYIQKTKFLN